MQHGRLRLSSHEVHILRFAVAVRCLAVLLAGLTSLLTTPFDTSGALALSSNNSSNDKLHSSYLLERLALPFTQWDTVHFLAIARDGYADEQKFAFLPGVPGLLALAGRLPYILGLSQDIFSPTIAVLSVSLIAACFSCLTPLVLYRLSLNLSGSTTFSATSSLLYILAPAPAVLSVPYTEPFYAFFAFSGMLCSVGQSRSPLRVALFFMIAAAFRANGILNVGFLAWQMIWQMPRCKLIQLLQRFIYLIALSALVVAPFVAHQAFAYNVFCGKNVQDVRPWCNATVPLVYSFVQEQYWNVGFLKYWTMQQLPNFILAAPVLALSFSASFAYYTQTWPECLFRSLPFSSTFVRTHGNKDKAADKHPFFNIDLLPCIHLHTALTLLLLFASHVQIALRQACTNPVIFWYAAYLVQTGDKKGKWWTGYCMIWGAVSVVLWTAFYPPA